MLRKIVENERKELRSDWGKKVYKKKGWGELKIEFRIKLIWKKRMKKYMKEE